MKNRPRREAVLTVRLEVAELARFRVATRAKGHTVSEYIRAFVRAVNRSCHTNARSEGHVPYTEVISCQQNR